MNLLIQLRIQGIVSPVVIFNHGLKFVIIFLVFDHSAHEKAIESKKGNHYRIKSSKIPNCLQKFYLKYFDIQLKKSSLLSNNQFQNIGFACKNYLFKFQTQDSLRLQRIIITAKNNHKCKYFNIMVVKIFAPFSIFQFLA